MNFHVFRKLDSWGLSHELLTQYIAFFWWWTLHCACVRGGQMQIIIYLFSIIKRITLVILNFFKFFKILINSDHELPYIC